MKILIADDDAVSRRLLEGYLRKWGHEVVVAEDGAVAWRLFQQQRFAVVISDWLMPEMEGPDLIRRIRSHGAIYVYTMLVTAKSLKEDVVEGMEAGADDFISKPFDRDELRVRLRAAERIMQLEQALAQRAGTPTEAQATGETSPPTGAAASAPGSAPHAELARQLQESIAQVSDELTALRRDLSATIHLMNQLRTISPTEAGQTAMATQVSEFQDKLPPLVERALTGLQRINELAQQAVAAKPSAM